MIIKFNIDLILVNISIVELKKFSKCWSLSVSQILVSKVKIFLSVRRAAMLRVGT